MKDYTQKSHAGDFLSVSQEFQRLKFGPSLTVKIRKRSKQSWLPWLWNNTGGQASPCKLCGVSSCKELTPSLVSLVQIHVLLFWWYGPPAIAEPANTVLSPVPHEQGAGTAWHFPCPCPRAGSWEGQAIPDCAGNSGCGFCTCLVNVRTAPSGKHWNCVLAVEIPELPRMDCVQDGNLLMPKVNHLATLRTAAPSEAL